MTNSRLNTAFVSFLRKSIGINWNQLESIEINWNHEKSIEMNRNQLKWMLSHLHQDRLLNEDWVTWREKKRNDIEEMQLKYSIVCIINFYVSLDKHNLFSPAINLDLLILKQWIQDNICVLFLILFNKILISYIASILFLTFLLVFSQSCIMIWDDTAWTCAFY